MNFLLESSAAQFWQKITHFLNFAKEQFLNFSWQENWSDVLDIVIMTILFVIAFNFLKSRKAGALIVGIIVCLLVFVVAQILDLDGIKFILSGECVVFPFSLFGCSIICVTS